MEEEEEKDPKKLFLQVVGKRLREERKRAGFNQEELSWLSGIRQGAISRYEEGKVEIGIYNLKRICGVLKITADKLLREDE